MNNSSLPHRKDTLEIDLTRPDLEDTDTSWDRTRVLEFMKSKGKGELVAPADEEVARRLLNEFHLDPDESGIQFNLGSALQAPRTDTVIDEVPHHSAPTEPTFNQNMLKEKFRAGNLQLDYSLGEWEDRLVGTVLLKLQQFILDIMIFRLRQDRGMKALYDLIKNNATFSLELDQNYKGMVYIRNYRFRIPQVPDIEISTFSWLDFCAQMEQLLNVYLERFCFHAEISRALRPELDKPGSKAGS